MDYVETILNKLQSLIDDLETLYDKTLTEEYDGDITKVTQSSVLTDEQKAFLTLGTDINSVRLIYDKIVENDVVPKTSLIEVNDLYTKYKLSGDVR